ncbi:hypothetical protein Glove_158g74 [Diversispora epigaea]|uniref:Uncharacterized protein n=1 Tax=Diversispora epigaea TaxID=1348612 RepID=A0A397IY27_9GLOM|nr:hypothetical protein Glove_158g74 [Diversispora epigaea]
MRGSFSDFGIRDTINWVDRTPTQYNQSVDEAIRFGIKKPIKEIAEHIKKLALDMKRNSSGINFFVDCHPITRWKPEDAEQTYH